MRETLGKGGNGSVERDMRIVPQRELQHGSPLPSFNQSMTVSSKSYDER